MFKSFFCGAALFSLASPVNGREAYEIKTPTGRVEALFQGKSAAEVQGGVAAGCMDSGWDVISSASGMVVCAHPVSDTTLYLLSPRRSTIEGVARFTITETQSGTRVIASDETVITNVFGQSRTTGGNYGDNIQDMLTRIGGLYPVGTQFNGIDLGIAGFVDAFRFHVREVVPGGAGEVGGLHVGDLIRKINGHSFDDLWWFRHKINDIAPGSIITFDVIRGKEKIKLSVPATAAAAPK